MCKLRVELLLQAALYTQAQSLPRTFGSIFNIVAFRLFASLFFKFSTFTDFCCVLPSRKGFWPKNFLCGGAIEIHHFPCNDGRSEGGHSGATWLRHYPPPLDHVVHFLSASNPIVCPHRVAANCLFLPPCT